MHHFRIASRVQVDVLQWSVSGVGYIDIEGNALARFNTIFDRCHLQFQRGLEDVDADGVLGDQTVAASLKHEVDGRLGGHFHEQIELRLRWDRADLPGHRIGKHLREAVRIGHAGTGWDLDVDADVGCILVAWVGNVRDDLDRYIKRCDGWSAARIG